jgi:hypothetical protein
MPGIWRAWERSRPLVYYSWSFKNRNCRTRFAVHDTLSKRAQFLSQVNISRWRYGLVAAAFDNNPFLIVLSCVDFINGFIKHNFIKSVLISLKNAIGKRFSMCSDQHICPNRNDGICGTVNDEVFALVLAPVMFVDSSPEVFFFKY